MERKIAAASAFAVPVALQHREVHQMDEETADNEVGIQLK
jgi:hypothetical protein